MVFASITCLWWTLSERRHGKGVRYRVSDANTTEKARGGYVMRLSCRHDVGVYQCATTMVLRKWWDRKWMTVDNRCRNDDSFVRVASMCCGCEKWEERATTHQMKSKRVSLLMIARDLCL